MSTAEIAQFPAAVERGGEDESIRELRARRWTLLRRLALVGYAIAFVVCALVYGIPVQRELVIAWVCGALACASIGRPLRDIGQLLIDWLPLTAILVLYDFTRGAADSLGIGVHFTTMIDFDRFIFGEDPTVWLQQHVVQPDNPHWWDLIFSLVYTSHFIVPFAVAGVLWASNRAAFKGFAKRFVTLSFVGLATYIAFPGAPPWLASEDGYLHGIARTTGQGYELLSVHFASAFDEGQATVNLTAAVPSLHAAFTMLVAMFLWPRVRWWWRPLLALYPLLMGFALMSTGEHYFFDILLGWIYAALVMVGWGLWELRKARLEGTGSSRIAPDGL